MILKCNAWGWSINSTSFPQLQYIMQNGEPLTKLHINNFHTYDVYYICLTFKIRKWETKQKALKALKKEGYIKPRKKQRKDKWKTNDTNSL